VPLDAKPKSDWLHIVNGVFLEPHKASSMALVLNKGPTGAKANVVLVWQTMNHWTGVGPSFRVLVMAKTAIPRLDVLVLDARDSTGAAEYTVQ
jgi:hypothetical protein